MIEIGNKIPEEEKATYSGISYKEKLKQIKSKTKETSSASSPAPPRSVEMEVQSTTTASEKLPERASATVNRMPNAWVEMEEDDSATTGTEKSEEIQQGVDQPMQMHEVPGTSETHPTNPVQQVATKLSPTRKPLQEQSQQKTVASYPQDAVADSAPNSEENQRQKIRTLMGLLLKHRGGPGFGKGVLQGPDLERFENLFNEVAVMLREEALQNAPAHASGASVSPTPSPHREPPVSQNSPPPSPVAHQYQANQASPNSQTSFSSAITKAPYAPSVTEQVESILACIEGAILMYKNSPPELKEGVLVTLRAALMSAVNTCNKVMGDNGIMSFDSFQSTRGGPATTSTPTQYYDVSTSDDVPEPEPLMSHENTMPQMNAMPPPTLSPTASGNSFLTPPNESVSHGVGTDRNSKRLDQIYISLTQAAGDGKLGLKADLDPKEASNLIEKIEEMRDILMEEIESGIPIPEPQEIEIPSEIPKSSTTSKYQQMLAKARAEKGAQS